MTKRMNAQMVFHSSDLLMLCACYVHMKQMSNYWQAWTKSKSKYIFGDTCKISLYLFKLLHTAPHLPDNSCN